MNRTVVVAAVGAFLVLGLVLFKSSDSRLAEARKEARAATEELKQRVRSEQAAWAAAKAQAEAADSARIEAKIERIRAENSKRALAAVQAKLSALGTAPDTCKKWIEAATGARDLANETARHWKDAFDAQTEATERLRQALDTVKAAHDSTGPATVRTVKATENLIAASRPSFGVRVLRALRPSITLNAMTFDMNKQVGGPSIGLGWRIPL